MNAEHQRHIGAIYISVKDTNLCPLLLQSQRQVHSDSCFADAPFATCDQNYMPDISQTVNCQSPLCWIIESLLAALLECFRPVVRAALHQARIHKYFARVYNG